MAAAGNARPSDRPLGGYTTVGGHQNGGSCRSLRARDPACKMPGAVVAWYQTGVVRVACYRSVGVGSRLEEVGE